MAAIALLGSGLALSSVPASTPVQAATTATQKAEITINYVPGYSIAVWSTPDSNKKPTGQLIKHGTTVQYTTTRTGADGYPWYQIAANQWISGHYAFITTVDSGIVTANYVPGYSIALWTKPTSDRKLTGKTLKHGASLPYSQVTVDNQGNDWFEVGVNQWANGKYLGAASSRWHPTTVKITAKAGTQVWNSPLNGQKQLNKNLKYGTSWKAFKIMVIGNYGWYNLGGNQWINAGQAIESK